MKRIIVLLSLIATLILSACTKNSASLAGTHWTGAEIGAVYDLTFTQSDFTLKEQVSESVITGSYLYEMPTVTFIPKKLVKKDGTEFNGGNSFYGSIDGNKLTMVVGTSSLTMIKQ